MSLVLEPDPNPEFYRLTVPSRLWAWSIKLVGFPIYALRADGSAVRIGWTSVRQRTYTVPADAVAIVRDYKDPPSKHVLYLMPLGSEIEYQVREVEGYDASHLPQRVREPFERFLKDKGYLPDP